MAPPTAPTQRPTMRHSSAFLLPSPAPGPNDARATVALVVLNQPLPRFAPLLWSRAALRVCADGGANRVFDGMPALHPGQDPDEVRASYKPDVIIGDMDSVRPQVKEHYSNLVQSALNEGRLSLTEMQIDKNPFPVRVNVIEANATEGTRIADESLDQDTTDLHKCITFVAESYPTTSQSNLSILVLGALGGRFDHEMGNINVLHLFPSIDIILLSDDCLIFLLPRTHTHEIHIERLIEGPHCGLIPIGMPSTSTTTTGLRWNLDYTSTSYGGLISTSNIVEEGKVTVASDSDLIWTISLRK